MKSVYTYLDFREFLRDRVRALKTTRWYSERAFAEKAGFSSPSFLKMVLDGKRNLSPQSARRVGIVLKLNPSELSFFILLARLALAKSDIEKEKIFKALGDFKKFAEVRRLDLDQLDYFSDWRRVAIKEALSTEFWKTRSLKEFADALDCSEHEVKKSLESLERLGLIRPMARGGYEAVSEALQSPREMRSLMVRNYHKDMLQRASEALDRYAISEREVGALTIPLTDEDFNELKETLFQMQNRMNAKYSGRKNASNVYQFNFQLFPLIKGPLGK